jgi:hypothetical protein
LYFIIDLYILICFNFLVLVLDFLEYQYSNIKSLTTLKCSFAGILSFVSTNPMSFNTLIHFFWQWYVNDVETSILSAVYKSPSGSIHHAFQIPLFVN